jgi:hypothetical protein
MNNIKYKSIEIVGTDMGSDGRSSGRHPVCCGEMFWMIPSSNSSKQHLKEKLHAQLNIVPIDTEFEIDAIPVSFQTNAVAFLKPAARLSSTRWIVSIFLLRVHWDRDEIFTFMYTQTY